MLQAQNPEKKFEIRKFLKNFLNFRKSFSLKNEFVDTMTTMGDRVLTKSLPKIGEKSLFTKDLEDALRNGGVDFVVHSLKDLPTALPAGMAIGAVLQREDPRDALVLNEKHKTKTLKTLPEGSTIGTSSLRRTAQLKRSYSHLKVCDIRGNLNTRLAKLDAVDSEFAGIILAQAGLVRMGWHERVSQILEPHEILYAVGQGALAVECRSNDEKTLEMLSKLCHVHTQYRILAERSFLKTLGGGCSAPVAVSTEILDDNNLEIKGAVWSLDGKIQIEDTLKCLIEDSNEGESQRKKLKILHDTPTKEDKEENNDKPNKKQISPKIIDETASTSAQSQSYDISKLINIHGDLFKKCPFSSTETTKSATQAPEFPIGQDFMGNCPYFETPEQKVDALKLDIKCPITGQELPSSSAATAKTGDNGNSSTTSTKVESCPFIAEQHRTQAESLEGNEENGVKLLDYSEKQDATDLPLIDNSDTLYCGMYRHSNVDQKVFEECENLGKQLAERLIKLGALDVMRVAQNEIREKA